MVKGVIFDFNGTLYIDHDINRLTWNNTICALTNNRLDFEGYYNTHKSSHDHLMIKDIISMFPDLQNEDVHYWINHKESAYRQYCVDHKRNKMTLGAEKVLDYLRNNNVKIGLCTSSPIENVHFYYSNLNLDRWFKMEYTIYDDESYTSKTKMYSDCAKLLDLKPEEVIVFEDSPDPIKEAIAAGVNKIVAIKREDTPNLPEIKQVIKDYTELDYSIFD